MTQTADLHTHSTASDGQYTPREVVMLAKKQGIEVLALTDHDTVDGLEEAVEAGKALGLRVLRGVELSAREYPNLHILGYGFVSGPSPLAALCGEMREHRNRRKDHIMAYLRGKGIHIPMEEVEALAAGASSGGPTSHR